MQHIYMRHFTGKALPFNVSLRLEVDGAIGQSFPSRIVASNQMIKGFGDRIDLIGHKMESFRLASGPGQPAAVDLIIVSASRCARVRRSQVCTASWSCCADRCPYAVDAC